MKKGKVRLQQDEKAFKKIERVIKSSYQEVNRVTKGTRNASGPHKDIAPSDRYYL